MVCLAGRALVALGAWGASSCTPAGFADPTLVRSVRILASSADKPYAAPGDTVSLSVLAYDGRPNAEQGCPSAADGGPCQVEWFPFVCKDPPNDAYYACLRQLAESVAPDAGVAGAPFQFQVPADAVSAHKRVPGSDAYGLVILFDMACAGHVERVPVDPNDSSPQTVPFGCFDDEHRPLGPADWVFGFTRVYVYPPGSGVTNANPVIENLDVDGRLSGLTALAGQAYLAPPLTVPRCSTQGGKSCADVHIGPVVPPSSQEAYTLDGRPAREQVWVDFYATFGSLDHAARLLYDVDRGSVGDASVTDDVWHPPNDPGDGQIWAVVHDNRGGASWLTIPVHVQ